MRIVSEVWTASSAALLACVIVAPSRGAELAEGLAFRSDIRVRHETYNRLGALTDEDYSRARVRLRVGADMKLDEAWDLSFRLATGGKPTSTNQDLNALNDEAEFYLDRAFLRFHAGDEGEGRALEVFVGRAPNPYVTSFMLWDADFNPDGLAERLVLKSDLSSRKFFVTAGQHVLGLDEIGAPTTVKTYGPGFFTVQPGVSFEAGGVSTTVAAGYYSFVDVDGVDGVFDGVPEDHGIADLVVKAKWSTASDLPLAVWLHGLKNLDAGPDNAAFGIGASVGSGKGRGKLGFRAEWVTIEKDALWVELADGTLTGRFTDRDMEAVRLGIEAGLGEATTLAVKWWVKTDRYSSAREEVLELDLIARF